MESKNCKWFGPNDGHCRDGSSVGALFHNFINNNVSTPFEMGELVGYVLLLVISWYALIFAFRFLLSLVKPVLIVLAALFLFRFLRTFGGPEMTDLFTQIASLIMSGVSKAVELFMLLLQ